MANYLNNHSNTLLSIKNLTIAFAAQQHYRVAVNQLNFKIKSGETFALLGESGCGKSLTALSIAQLLPPIANISRQSEIILSGQNLLNLPEVAMRKVRGRKIAMIFQEPMTSLNPVTTIGQQIIEVLACHFKLTGKKALNRALSLLEQVGFPDIHHYINAYPHQLSGGLKQRAMIAMALAGEPELLLADEPTTALDVTIQAQVLALLKDLQVKKNMAMLLITHDLAVAKQMADDVAVMYAGQIIEKSTAPVFFKQAKHPYSLQLFAALPSLARRQQRLASLKGNVPKLTEAIVGCRFAPRCPMAFDKCFHEEPTYQQLNAKQQVHCHLYDSKEGKQHPSKKYFYENLATNPKTQESSEILRVDRLKVYYPIHKGILQRTVGHVKAVDDISFSIKKGETYALVGESGSGKSTTGQAILKLLPITSGAIYYNNQSLSDINKKNLLALRKQIQIIFQDPFSAMNPRMMVVDILMEGMRAHRLYQSEKKKLNRIKDLLKQIGLDESMLYRYPHEFSGGQRQRICIARALTLEPKLIICDEPTSALDVSVQAQIINLLKELQMNFDLSYLFISHNMSVIAYLADKIAVMKQGSLVEQGTAVDILQNPQHAYTKELLAAVPEI